MVAVIVVLILLAGIAFGVLLGLCNMDTSHPEDQNHWPEEGY